MIRSAVAVLLFHIPRVLFAQVTTGNIEGRVTDTTGAAIIGANVTLSSPDLQGVRGISTGEQGFFRLVGLPIGKYSVTVQHVSYRPVTLENVQIRLDKTTALPDLIIQQSTVALPDVIISGQRPLLDPSTATSGANLPHENFDVLPIDRNYRNIVSLAPHANQSYYGDEANLAGATGTESRYFVNGNDVTDMTNGMGGTNLPYNFIRELEVKTGGYEPEYRSSLGGIINVVTYSGGNEFSGQVFGFYTNSNLGGKERQAPTDPPKGSFTQYDFGLALGGPILKDGLWFYAALNPSSRTEDIEIPGLGKYPDQLRTQTFAGKLSWRASDVFDLSATVVGDPTTEKAVNRGASPAVSSAATADPFLETISSGGYNVLVDARDVASENLVLQGSLSWATRKQKYEPSSGILPPEQKYFDYVTQTASGGTGIYRDDQTSILGAKVSAIAMVGDHAVKAGMEYREIVLDTRYTNDFLFKTSDTSFAHHTEGSSGTIRNRVPSLFIQDSWSVNRYLRIAGGLRWDGLFIIASNGELATRILRQYQPRFGIVFMPGGDESQKVFASVGRYEEDLMLFGSTLYHVAGSYAMGVDFNHDPRINPAGGDTSLNIVSTVRPGVQDLYGQYYDEATLGYERLLAQDFKVTFKGTYRALREVIDDAEAPVGSGEFYYGNPGEGVLSEYPHPRREYLSLEMTVEKSWGSRFNLLASYVLSRNYGNFLGLYYQERGTFTPNVGGQFDWLDMYTKNATGLLPNDRTHIFKLNASYQFDDGLTCGALFLWESGTPLSEYAAKYSAGLTWPINQVQRGSAGRLPSLWDLNLRLAYLLPFWSETGFRPRLIIDVFHVASQRQVVMQDELHYLNIDAGNPVDPNPNYGMPQKFQPPMSVRLGIEVNF